STDLPLRYGRLGPPQDGCSACTPTPEARIRLARHVDLQRGCLSIHSDAAIKLARSVDLHQLTIVTRKVLACHHFLDVRASHGRAPIREEVLNILFHCAPRPEVATLRVFRSGVHSFESDTQEADYMIPPRMLTALALVLALTGFTQTCPAEAMLFGAKLLASS